MTPLLFALAMLAAPPEVEVPSTAGQLYDGCVRLLRVATESSGPPERREEAAAGAMCAAEVAIMGATATVEAAMRDAEPGQPDRRTFCPPESLLEPAADTGSAFARAFIDYVDRNPASRDLEYDEVFKRALAEKWPCSH